ncbi:GNAT family N-acetyltransferase [Hamadaea tsunoensis]|uniref:GNAT family N-acetyltransferase n=1 Tax=Hamadaea tsunoensis TaxID=53368 RepID=UPI000413CC61|nr:GNAT family N-acetyltransferase [Hamadaea tsunoensis]
MEIRLAYATDLPVFREIEVEAGRLFVDIGMPEIAGYEALPLEVLARHQAEGYAWAATAAGTAVGYLIAEPVDGCLHIEQISVLPSHGRRGFGAALLAAVAARAVADALPALTLTTFVDVPWNAPYYERHGFHRIGDDELTPGLRVIRDREIALGLDRWPRTAMRRDLR